MRSVPVRIGYGYVLGIGFAIGLTLAAFPADTVEPWHADATLRDRVDASIALHRALMPFDIAVAVDERRAVLEGSVDDVLERELAGRVAASVDGIRTVDNRLKLEPDRARWLGRHSAMAGFGIDDRRLAVAVRAQLRWHRATRGLDVDVSCSAGTVILRGHVPERRLATAAERIAARTHGVYAVDNRLQIERNAHDVRRNGWRQALSDRWLQARVKSALLVGNGTSGIDLAVSVDQGLVGLQGMVSSRTELDLVEEIAAGIDGVRAVDTSRLRLGLQPPPFNTGELRHAQRRP